MALPIGVLSLLDSPSRDWLPAGLPITYSFSNSLPAFPYPIVVQIQVSDNNEDFDNPITAGLLQLEPDAFGNYSVNVGPYVNSTFGYSTPVFGGVDVNLWKLYRLQAWSLADYEAAEPPTITTDEQRALNATVATPEDTTMVLSKNPALPLNDSYAAIQTVVDTSTGTVINQVIVYEPTIQGASRCPKYPVYLCWLNRPGGLENFAFDGKHEYTDEIGESVKWKDSQGATHVASIPDVVKKVAVKSGLIPPAYYDVVCTIRHAIRVWALDATGIVSEGYIEGGSFPTRKEGERLRECNFTFVYSEPLAVQQA